MTSEIPPSALALGRAIADGTKDPRDLVEDYADRISQADPDARIFYRRTFDRARSEAAASYERARAGLRRSPVDGVPLSWKDLYDSAGDETPAGSMMLAGRTPRHDATALARLTAAGTVCLGKTAMTELAFSGLGINPVMGTPANAHDSDVARVPGGSSSGAGVSLAHDLCAASIGTDTGGSVRIPAAWNGVVGFKPSHGIIPSDGVVPLCPTLDTIGPLTRDVADAACLYSLLSGSAPISLDDETLKGRTLLVPKEIVFDDADPGVAQTIEAALDVLATAGATIRHETIEPLTQMNALTWDSGISLAAAEAWAVWGETIREHGDLMYPPVRTRFEGGAKPNAGDVWKLMRVRDQLRATLIDQLASIDAIAMPTISIDPPPIAELEDGGPAYDRANKLALRNTTLGNQLDMCAITLPAGTSTAGLPVGLMLMAPKGRDARLLRLASAVEKALS
ncbi:MAG: amidase family protein [Alphaproteobacteria bacterium]|nr:amidase family protein [Alphaproteobacteria bacterium]